MSRKLLPGVIVVLLIMAFLVNLPGPARAAPASQDDLVEHGEYLATIAGCIGCHTPVDENFKPISGKEFSGGLPFPLGPLGTVFTKNLTSDPETGLGNWTDEEIKRAIRVGKSKDGLHLFPIMPYVIFNGMAEADLDAIVAFLRTLPPISNAVPRQQILPPEQLPNLPERTGIVAPDPKDTAARGVYLLTSVIACTDCHTPLDPSTGAPIREKYMAGGQPYEGPWGIVYAGNITPDEATGIGQWTDEEIERILRQGVRPEGRRVVLMPWQEYTHLTDDDAKAVIHYLRNNVPAVGNEVPAAALNEGWIEKVEIEPAAVGPDTGTLVAVGFAVVVFIGGVAFALRVNRRK